jgi:hypothetical protein
MADDIRSFTDLKTTLIKAKTNEPAAEPGAESKPKLDKQGRAYATGKRKNAIARVWLKPGPGRILVNGREEKIYFARPVLRMILRQPLWPPTATISSTSSAKCWAAGCRGRQARCATAFPRRWSPLSRACGPC